jgi:hypothetical protein
MSDLDRLSEPLYQRPVASHQTSLAQTSIQRVLPDLSGATPTSPVKTLPNGSFEVGVINKPPPTPLSCWPLRKSRASLEIQILSSSSSLPKIQVLNPCSWDKIWAPLWVSHLIQARALHHLPRRPWLCLLLLGIQSPRWLGVTQELPRVVVESQKVCIALLFMVIDSEEPG